MTKPITTTLNAIRTHFPCEDGWEKLLKHLGKTRADDEPLKFSTILESNGVVDAIWCLRSLSGEHAPEIRHFACDCAEHVLHVYEEKYPGDARPRKAIEVARRYANGEATTRELNEASDDAYFYDARAVYFYAARAAAWAACFYAAWAAAWAAARDARAAADDTERARQAELLIKYFG